MLSHEFKAPDFSLLPRIELIQPINTSDLNNSGVIKKTNMLHHPFKKSIKRFKCTLLCSRSEFIALFVALRYTGLCLYH